MEKFEARSKDYKVDNWALECGQTSESQNKIDSDDGDALDSSVSDTNEVTSSTANGELTV